MRHHGYTIEEKDLASLGDDELAPIVELANRLGAEREPRHTELSIDEFRLFTNAPGRIRRHFVAKDVDGKIAAMSTTSYRDDGTNADLLSVSIGVSPDHRRRGLASKFLLLAVAEAESQDRSTLDGSILDTVEAGRGFTTTAGAVETMEFRMNSVKLADLPLDTLSKWRDEGPVRSPDYSVEGVAGQYPDAMLEGVAHLYVVLERDMPHPDSWEPRQWTPELVKEQMGHYLQGTEVVTAVAFRRDTGAAAGMSQLMKRNADPRSWFVTVTMVDPDHRGHALGKWLKAAVCLEALEVWQDGVWMETFNAEMNDAMLGINHEMGFEHEYTMTSVEIDVDQAKKYIAGRP